MSAKKLVLSMAGTFLLGIIIGATLLYNNSVYNAVRDAINGEATQNSIGSVNGTSGISQINIQNMDLETALMAVQSERTKLLENQLKSQIEDIQARNDKVAKLNQLIGVGNEVLAKLPSDAKSDTPISMAADKATMFTDMSFEVPLTKSALDVALAQIRGQIDSASNSQQMDMLRLQSLSNKRNEAFDVMTNFIKKMQDSRSSIIGNMR